MFMMVSIFVVDGASNENDEEGVHEACRQSTIERATNRPDLKKKFTNVDDRNNTG